MALETPLILEMEASELDGEINPYQNQGPKLSDLYYGKFFYDDLNRLIASYFWNGDVGNKKIHWCSWDRLCATKVKGGLGFRNILAFNYAMLAKQDWRILTEPNSLVAKVLKGKYFLNSSFLDAWVNPDTSYCWKSICLAHRIISLGICWEVGNGLNIRV